MGALRGYFDDSGHEPDPHCNCVVYAGYIGNCAEWTRLEEGWKIALGRLYYLIEAISAHESREVPILDHITFTFLAKNTPSRHPTDGSQNIYALQVADFLAWETHFFARERIKNGYESADRLRRETYDVIAPDSDWPLSMFLNDRTLTNWSDQKKGAWPNTRQGRLVKSWVEFSQELERKLKN